MSIRFAAFLMSFSAFLSLLPGTALGGFTFATVAERSAQDPLSTSGEVFDSFGVPSINYGVSRGDYNISFAHQSGTFGNAPDGIYSFSDVNVTGTTVTVGSGSKRFPTSGATGINRLRMPSADAGSRDPSYLGATLGYGGTSGDVLFHGTTSMHSPPFGLGDMESRPLTTETSPALRVH